MKSHQQESGYRDVVFHLESLIAEGRLAPGARMPSLRRLCYDFGISMGTAVRAMEVLQRKNLVESRRGAGSYVRLPDGNGETGDERFRIGVFIGCSDRNVTYLAHALRGAQEAAMERNCSLLITRMYAGSPQRRELLREAAAQSRALLLMGEYDAIGDDLPRNVPGVGVEMQRSCGGLYSTVLLDPCSAATIAADFFRKRGCRHIRMFHSPELPVHTMRAALFREAWSKYGTAELLSAPDFAYNADVPLPELGGEAIGCWFSGGTYCQAVARAWRLHHGSLLAAERTILSIDGKSLLIPGYEPVNTIGIDWHEAGVAAFEECLRRITSPGSAARHICLEGKLHEFNQYCIGN